MVLPQARVLYMIFPIAVVAIGLIASLIGIISIKLFGGKNPAAALRNSTYVANLLLFVGVFIFVKALSLPVNLFWVIVVGNLVGVVIGALGGSAVTQAVLEHTKKPVEIQ